MIKSSSFWEHWYLFYPLGSRTWRLTCGFFKSLIVGIVPGVIAFPAYADKRHKAAVANLTRARTDAREHGNARMAEIRKRVQEIKAQDAS